MGNLSRTGVIIGASIASASMVLVAGIGVASSYRTVTLEADGTVKSLEGFFPDVRSVLAAGDVDLGEFDAVEPALDIRIASGQNIAVLRAQPYQVTADGETTTEWSHAVSLEAVFEDVASETDGSIVVSRTQAREPLPLAGSAKTVAVSIDGKVQQVKASGGDEVAEILKTAKFAPSALDEVRIELVNGAPGISVITEQRAYTTKTEPIAFTEKRVDDPDLEKGTEEVTQAGKKGQRTIVTYTRVRGGKTVLSTVFSNVVSKKPVQKVVAVGTKKPAEKTSGGTGTKYTFDPENGDVWAALAKCESGGKASTNTGNGYYGLYQFSLGTWKSVGGAGLPSDASAEEQTARAQKLQKRSGWGQWPACASKLGLI